MYSTMESGINSEGAGGLSSRLKSVDGGLPSWEPSLEAFGRWVVQVPIEDVERFWPPKVLERAFARSGGIYTEEAVLERLRKGEWQLWMGFRGSVAEMALLTAVMERDDGKRACHLMMAGGQNAAEWLEVAANALEKWMAGNGCVEVMCSGRLGWKRELARFGFKLAFVTLRRVL